MNKTNRLLKKNQLSKLVNRFSKSYVIEEMEKNLRQAKSTELLVTNIDDNAIIKSAVIPNDALKNIADSINKNGLTNPLIVRPKKNYYEIVFGRKRLLAMKKYKIYKAPARIINVSDEEMLFMLLADNREQRDANIIETALVLKELSEKYNYNQTTLAELAHQSRSQITNILRLLNLPKWIIDDISVGKLSYGHAKAIASLPETSIEELVNKIYEEGLSVREIEGLAKKKHAKGNQDTSVILLKKFKCEVDNKDKTLVISFTNNKEKDKFLENISKNN
ncbi:MAG: ParB/RepB/Spo0J family partition protein [Bacilli bacterium]|nr:ParB/RepB/Spo0J family partition protein [Bacilli bacterium]